MILVIAGNYLGLLYYAKAQSSRRLCQAGLVVPHSKLMLMQESCTSFLLVCGCLGFSVLEC